MSSDTETEIDAARGGMRRGKRVQHKWATTLTQGTHSIRINQTLMIAMLKGLFYKLRALTEKKTGILIRKGDNRYSIS